MNLNKVKGEFPFASLRWSIQHTANFCHEFIFDPCHFFLFGHFFLQLGDMIVHPFKHLLFDLCSSFFRSIEFVQFFHVSFNLGLQFGAETLVFPLFLSTQHYYMIAKGFYCNSSAEPYSSSMLCDGRWNGCGTFSLVS